MSTFSDNLKRFRIARNYTQEQAAEIFGVSAQTVSRWECNTTLPDVTMLPRIAEAYCVTIDDLYREKAVAYDNYAQRLGSIYEATLEPEDFLRAEQEYRRMLKSGSYTTEDMRLYGILHHHMMFYCIRRSIELFDRVLEQGPQADPETYWRTKRQKIYLFSEIGRHRENIEEALAPVQAGSEDVNEWLCLLYAYSFAEDEAAFECYQKAAEKFPDNALLCGCGGDLYAELGRYEEAFRCWDRALELAPSLTDAMYSKGFCYEKLGDYRKACEIWTKLADELERRGYDSELTYPRELAKKARDRIKG